MMKKSIFKRLVYTPSDLSARFTCKVNLSNTKFPAWVFFILAPPFRQRGATCKLAATEDYRVFHKMIFRGCAIIHSLSSELVEETMINLLKLRWWATRLFCLGRICVPGLIYCDRTWLIFLGVHIRLLIRWETCFTLGLSNYFSLKSLSLCFKSHMNVP